MKIYTLTASAALCSLLLSSPAISIAGNFDQVVKQATTEIDKAKSAGYEWRDSRKILKQAQKAEKAGEHEKALKLANKAKQQGIIAVAQAEQQANSWQKSIKR